MKKGVRNHSFFRSKNVFDRSIFLLNFLSKYGTIKLRNFEKRIWIYEPTKNTKTGNSALYGAPDFVAEKMRSADESCDCNGGYGNADFD